VENGSSKRHAITETIHYHAVISKRQQIYKITVINVFNKYMYMYMYIYIYNYKTKTTLSTSFTNTDNFKLVWLIENKRQQNVRLAVKFCATMSTESLVYFCTKNALSTNLPFVKAQGVSRCQQTRANDKNKNNATQRSAPNIYFQPNNVYNKN